MQTLKVDIIDDKALNLLKDLELLKLIRLHEENDEDETDNTAKYKGAMTKQSLEEVNIQLQNLRNGWE